MSASVTGRRYARRASFERIDRGAGPLLCERGRTACEHALTAWRVAGADGVERAADRHVLDMRKAEVVGGNDRVVQEVLQPDRTKRRRLLKESRGDHPLSCLNGDARLQARIERVDDVGRVVARHHVVVVTADWREKHAFAAYRNLELVQVLKSADRTQVRFNQLHSDDVFSVEWEGVPGGDTATRAERQALEMFGLRHVAADTVGFGTGGDLRAPDGERADFCSRRQVAFQQRRRHAQHVRDVIETIGESSGGSSVDASTSSASRSRMALAYSARFNRWSAVRPGLGCSVAARSRRDSRNPRSVSCDARSGRGRPVGRHGTGPNLSHNVFPKRRIVRHMIQIRAVEHDAGSRRGSGYAAVVTSDTVLIHRRANRGSFRLNCLHGRGGCSARVLRALPQKRQPDISPSLPCTSRISSVTIIG